MQDDTVVIETLSNLPTDVLNDIRLLAAVVRNRGIVNNDMRRASNLIDLTNQALELKQTYLRHGGFKDEEEEKLPMFV